MVPPEPWFCASCTESGRRPLVVLDKHGRCDVCGSDAVTTPTTPLHEIRRSNSLVYKP